MLKSNIISLHGSYTNNYGDVLIINLFYRWIKEAFPDSQVNLPLVNKKKVHEMPEPTLTGIRNLLRSRCLVFCGGGYFGEKPIRKGRWSVRNFFRHGVLGILAIILRIPIAVIGVEVGPLSKTWFRRIVLFILNHSKVILVRNQESYDFLKRYNCRNVELGADAVLTLNQDYCKMDGDSDENSNNISKNDIVLHLPGYRNHKKSIDFFVTQMLANLSDSKNSYKIIFIEDAPEQMTNGYENLFKIVKDQGYSYSFFKYSGINNMISVIKNSKYVFTTKLHVGITAAAYNTRVFALYLHPKTLRFHNQIGNERFCFSLSEIKDNSGLQKTISGFLKSPEPSLPKEVLTLALKNRIRLQEFLRDHVS